MIADTALIRASDRGMLNTVTLKDLDMSVVHFNGNGNFQLALGIFEHYVFVGGETHHCRGVLKNAQHIFVRIFHVGNLPFKKHIFFPESQHKGKPNIRKHGNGSPPKNK